MSNNGRGVASVWRLAAAGMLLVGFILLVGQADQAGAQTVVDPTSCGHFETQADAQAALDSGTVPNPEHLDPDGDGIACEEAFGLDPDSPPPARDYTTCGHFETQESAQEALDSGILPNPEFLDGDGDGIACEEAFGTTGSTGTAGTTTLPSTGSGSPLGSGTSTHTLLFAGFLFAAAGVAIMFQRRLIGR